MKLENVDLSKLQLTDLPKFDKCPCELCDDGCFDRAGGEHHPNCRRKAVQRTQLPAAYRCPVSHYKSTFVPVTSVSGGPADHRRQPCPPPPDNEIPIAFKHAPMSGVSSQRDHYPPPPPDSLKKTSPAAVKQVFLMEVIDLYWIFCFRLIVFYLDVQFPWKHKVIIKLNIPKNPFFQLPIVLWIFLPKNLSKTSIFSLLSFR